jgi:hypothetical protein
VNDPAKHEELATPLHYAPLTAARRRGILRHLTLVALCFTATATLGYTAWRSQRDLPPVARTATAPTANLAAAPQAPTVDRAAEVEKVYRQDVAPRVAEFEARNRQAVAAALADVRERMNGRRSGIKPFVADVNRWKTRFSVIGKSAKDFWQRHWYKHPEADTVRPFVDAKFRHHVLSEAALQADLGAALATFGESIEASRNRLYVDLRLPLEKIRIAGAATAPSDLAAFRASVEAHAREQADRLGREFAGDSVAQGVNALVLSTAAAEVSQRIVAGVVTSVLARVGTQLAARTVAAGGATAVGTVTGGGGGSVAGPAGTVVGAAVGLAIGVVVDMAMSKRFEAKMTQQLNAYFDTLTHHLIDGGNAGGPGLSASLTRSVEHLNEVQRRAIHQAMREMAR